MLASFLMPSMSSLYTDLGMWRRILSSCLPTIAPSTSNSTYHTLQSSIVLVSVEPFLDSTNLPLSTTILSAEIIFLSSSFFGHALCAVASLAHISPSSLPLLMGTDRM